MSALFASNVWRLTPMAQFGQVYMPPTNEGSCMAFGAIVDAVVFLPISSSSSVKNVWSEADRTLRSSRINWGRTMLDIPAGFEVIDVASFATARKVEPIAAERAPGLFRLNRKSRNAS